MKTNSLLYYSLLACAISVIVGWSFELPKLERTNDAEGLLLSAVQVGFVLGLVGGILLARTRKGFIQRFQLLASCILLGVCSTALFTHWVNRTVSSGEPQLREMRVKQVRANWKGRGLTREMLESPPEGYFVFVESDEATIRLFWEGPEPPDIGPSRTVSVEEVVGFFGYSRYSIVNHQGQ